MIIDLHLHILPGVDDGASDMNQALEMAVTAAQSGVTHLVATPHYQFYGHPDTVQIQDAFSRLADQLAFEEIPIALSLATEHFACPELPERLHKEGCYPNSRYFLVEFAPSDHPKDMDILLQRCAAEGFLPVAAHPERYFGIQEHPHYARDWAEKGWGVQINRDSLMGRFGPARFLCADLLLQKDWANIIASDAHSTGLRNTRWEQALDLFSQRYSQATLRRCLWDTPNQILQNKPIESTGNLL